jgi:PST family polysaccharide transporter
VSSANDTAADIKGVVSNRQDPGGEFERLNLNTESLKADTLRGGADTALAQVVKLGLQFASVAVLSRLLSPSDFGLVAMVTAVTGGLRVIKDGGLSTATVQKQDINEEQISTLFWINLSLGTALALVTVALAFPIAAFYRESRLVAVTMTLSGVFVLGALTVQHEGMLRRRMRFRALAVIDVLAMVIGLGLGVVLALGGYGYWALVWSELAKSLVTAVLTFVALPWVPGPPRRRAGIRSLLRFGGFQTSSDLLNYLFRNADNVLIGWYWGPGPLGIYTRAYSLLLVAIRQINAPVSRVAVSTLSRLQGDPGRLRRYFLAGYSMVAFINVPLIAAMVVFAEEVVQFVLGPQWTETVGVFRLLAPAAVLGALINPFGWLFQATGNPDREFRFGLLWSGVLLIAFAAGLPYGPAGVALGYSVASGLLTLPLCFYAVKGTAVRAWDLGESIRPSLASAGVAVVAGLIVKGLLPLDVPVGMRAIGGCTVIGAVYLLFAFGVLGQWGFYRGLLREVSR